MAKYCDNHLYLTFVENTGICFFELKIIIRILVSSLLTNKEHGRNSQQLHVLMLEASITRTSITDRGECSTKWLAQCTFNTLSDFITLM
ncbi:14402_t:CDS:2 [Cetraspora pellucida]|uniref:14402_t:CDS:1 n=1 Tax=Cetraspora pellucida TaxID=1433469 RepID=A0A9N8ZCP9_9GLOM|nr:14402_t:CDS:2 [Cetraspora pellucida]